MLLNKDKNNLQIQKNINSINNFQNKNNPDFGDMDLEMDIKDLVFSNRTNSCFSNFFQEENKKLQQINTKDNNDNIFGYNIPPLKNIPENNIQIQQNNIKYPISSVIGNNNNFNMNKNQILNNNINYSENLNRFINIFTINENKLNNSLSNIPFDNNRISNVNNNINNIMNNNNLNKSMFNNINNNMINNKNNIINNNIIENDNFSCIYKNLNNNLNYDNNYINYSNNSNNLSKKFNFIRNNNYQYESFTNNINILNKNDLNPENNNIGNNKDINNNIEPNSFGINNIIIPNTILSRNSDYEEFLNYVNNLNMPLIKFLCTKKGIAEMEIYLNNHKKNNIEILIYLLNKEGLSKLMKHKFGNYFIQEIIKDAKYPQIKLILELISQNFVEISETNSGTHVLQALLDKVNNFELRNIVIKSIENKELEMAFNNNATYVFQKIIEIIPDYERLNTNEIIINNVINLSLNADCVFIVEKFISNITIKENKEKIKDILCQNCIQLATSPFGNYLIQYLFQIWKDSDIEKINDIIIDNANFLVKQRYSSNVIEKAIDTFDNKIKPRLIRSLSLGGDILDIIKNQYGHYVLNKAVKYMDEKLKNEIETILNNQMPEMTKKEKTKSKKFIANLKKNGKNKKGNAKK